MEKGGGTTDALRGGIIHRFHKSSGRGNKEVGGTGQRSQRGSSNDGELGSTDLRQSLIRKPRHQQPGK